MPGDLTRAADPRPARVAAAAFPRVSAGGGFRKDGSSSPAAARASTPRRPAARRVQALEAVLAPPQADLLVAVSHEGGTRLTLEAARGLRRARLARDGQGREPARRARRRGPRRGARDRGVLLPYGELHLRGRGACRPARRRRLRASGGGRASARRARARLRPRARRHRRRRAATGRPRRRRRSSCAKGPTWPRRPTRPSSSCTGTSPRSTSRVRAFVLEGEGRRPSERRRRACARRARRRDHARAHGAIRSWTSSASSCSRSTWPSAAASTRT